jgi:hypothetical protein
MRKVFLFTVAVALMVPAAALTAGPANAAGGTTCAKPSGTITITPGLTSTPTVQTTSVVLPVKGLRRRRRHRRQQQGFDQDRQDQHRDVRGGAPVTFNDTITWNTKATTTSSAKATTKISSKSVITSTVTGKVTKGLFVGSSVSVVVNVKRGPLVHNAVHTLIITANTKFVIK